MSKIDLYSAEWCELIFEGRNIKYGAYDMRMHTESRHRCAMMLTSAFFVALMTVPTLIKTILPERREQNVTINSLADIQVETVEKKKKERPLDMPRPTDPIPELRSSIKNVAPIIKPDEEVPADEAGLRSQRELLNSTAVISIADIVGTNEQGPDVSQLTEDQIKGRDIDDAFVVVDQMPQFPGGMNALNAYLQKNLRYPDLARENDIQGLVVLAFIVGADGAISNITVSRSLDPDCDAEAIRVVKTMPRWDSGRQGSKAVNVQFTLPVRFRLN